MSFQNLVDRLLAIKLIKINTTITREKQNFILDEQLKKYKLTKLVTILVRNLITNYSYSGNSSRI